MSSASPSHGPPPAALLEGKRVLVTGVSTGHGIAFAVARLAQEARAEVVLSSFGRMRSVAERSTRRLPGATDVLELDVTDERQLARAAEELGGRWGRLDGLIHAVAHAPSEAMNGSLGSASAGAASRTFEVSAASLARLVTALRPLLRRSGGASVVSLGFESTVAWPSYDWMGVSKAALESVSRYLARDLGADGIRVNVVCAGPIRTPAASQIPDFERIADAFEERAPLGWDRADAGPVAGAVCFLLSDWARGMTGQTLHVDGGCRAIGLAPA
jgi:meromycolic acid enoyl-[acyl-carrier-protein] reductase